jgi:hypothetical protein
MADAVQHSGNPSAVQTVPPGRRDAIIFIPGLGGQSFGPDQSVDGVSRRISTAFNIRAKTASAVFRTEVREQAYGPHDCYKARVATVFRRDGTKEEALLDLYGMDYGCTLTGRFEQRNILVKFLLTLLQFANGLWLLLSSGGKTWREKVQVLYAGSILLVFAAYMVVLVIAAIDIGASALGKERVAPPTANTQVDASHPFAIAVNMVQYAPTAVADWFARNRETFRASIVVLAAFGVVFPANFKGHLSAAATTYLCALYYIRLGDRRNELIAQLEALLERTAELEGVEYGRTHIVAYSFGSLIAIDALFRLGAEAPPTRFRRIHTFITIGCPFDLIRTYWPSYFRRRTAAAPDPDQPSPPARWMNIYSPLDVLGSNFRNDGKDAPADQGVQLIGEDPAPATWPIKKPDDNVAYGAGPESAESLRVRDYLMFVGFRVHGFYWNREDEPSTDCFSRVVEALYKDQPPLM